MRYQVLSSATTLLIFFILLFVYIKVAGPIPFNVTSVTTTKTTTFDVTGTGKAQATSNIANVQAGVSAQGNTTQDVQNTINTTIGKVSSAVKALGVDSSDIQTSNYSVNPNFDYTGGTQKQNGYSASTNLTIKVRDVSKVGSIIDAATNAGATNVNNLGFDSTDKTSAENSARNLAIADAKQKAQTAAKAAGFNLGKLVNYSESENGAVTPLPMLKAVGGGNATTPTPIESGSNEVDMTVTLSFEIN